MLNPEEAILLFLCMPVYILQENNLLKKIRVRNFGNVVILFALSGRRILGELRLDRERERERVPGILRERERERETLGYLDLVMNKCKEREREGVPGILRFSHEQVQKITKTVKMFS